MNNLPKAYLDVIDLFNNLEAVSYQKWAEELLQENGLTLPDNAYVFNMHQGYVFNFFILTEGDDPPIYNYCEGKSITQTFSTFTEFLVAELKYYNSLIQL